MIRALLAAAVLASSLLGASAQPQRPVLPQAQAALNSPDPDMPYWANDRFDRLRFTNDFTNHYVLSRDPRDLHAYAFFPPTPPSLESEIPVLAPLDSGPAAAPELSAFVNDVFYPFMGVRLAYGELLKNLRVEIVAYRNAKVQQQVRLRAKILELKNADEPTRRAQLSAFAAEQAPRIAELDAMAEKLRSDLRQIHIVGLPIEYTDLVEKPEWRVRAAAEMPTDYAELRLKSEAVRGLAFYEEGLSPSQRHLLFEESMELEAASRSTPSPTPPNLRTLYFSPAGARIRIPTDLPEALERKIGEYTAEKKALEAEVRATLKNNEDVIIDTRSFALQQLAAAQAPRFAGLDRMAEEIRSGLAGLPNLPGPPAAPTLPPDLMAHISTYRMHKVELLRKLRAMLDSPTPTLSADRAGRGPDTPDPVQSALAWMHDGSSRTEIQSTDLRVSVGEFDRMQSELIGALNKEENVIREELAAYARTTNGPTDRKSINDLLRDFEDARQRQEIWDKYRDYRAAVLMPGLSAGQRRLLFDAGVEQLALPLPAGVKVN
jgi:hypothetical protein